MSSMKGVDVRRLWEKLHNSDVRENCYSYYREATFDPVETVKRSTTRQPQKMSLMRRLAVNSTEGKVGLALCAILGVGIGVTRLLAYSSQTSSLERVDAHMDTLRRDWDQYQDTVKKS